MHFGVSNLENYLDQGFYADEFDIKDLKLGLESGYYLAILLIDMDEEALKAIVDNLCEESKV